MPQALDSKELRVAASFVHCVEAGTSGCVTPGEDHGGWDALHTLLWLASGSPLAILENLPQTVARHNDPLQVQRRFVEEVERYAAAIRGAQCDAKASLELGPLVERASQASIDRLHKLGIWQSQSDKLVEDLKSQARADLDGGWLVRIDCLADPYRLFLAVRETDGIMRIVGMTTYLDTAFGGEMPTPEQVANRLAGTPLGVAGAQTPIIEGAVDPWLPFPLEEL